MISVQNVKSFRCDLKRGLGLQDLCDKHECTESELESNLRALYKHNAEAILKQLRRNDHRQEKLRRKPHIQPTIVSIGLPSEPTINAQPAEPTTAEQITDLKRQEQAALDSSAAYSARLHELEIQEESCLQKLSAQQGYLKRIQQTAQDFQRQTAELLDQYKAIQTDMHTTRNLLHNHQSRAIGLREQIDELEQITIFAYSDGEIEPIDDTDINLDDAGSDQIYDSLISDEACLDLRVRDIRTIARVISIIHNAPVRVLPFFEAEELTACFQHLRSSHQNNVSQAPVFKMSLPEPNLA